MKRLHEKAWCGYAYGKPKIACAWRIGGIVAYRLAKAFDNLGVRHDQAKMRKFGFAMAVCIRRILLRGAAFENSWRRRRPDERRLRGK